MTDREEGAWPANLAASLAARTRPRLLEALREAGALADSVGVSLYAVGGFVRDVLLGLPVLDVDLVLEGDGIAFARRLAERLGGRCTPYRAFGTASVMLPDGLRIDLATARREHYAHPGALPEVSHAPLTEDLARRDFTINAMAVGLNAAAWGTLRDPWGGRRDLAARRLRILHPASFVDDPTRILRAARLGARGGFRLGAEEERAVQAARAGGAIGRVEGRRYWTEFRLLCAEPDPPVALRELRRLGILGDIHPALAFPPPPAAALGRLARLASGAGGWAPPDRAHLWLLTLLAGREPGGVAEVTQRLQLAPRAAERLAREAAVLRRLLALWRRAPASRPRVVARRLAGAAPEIVMVLAALLDPAAHRAALRRHLDRTVRARDDDALPARRPLAPARNAARR